MKVEGREIGGQREHLAGGAEGVGVPERQGAAGDVDVAGEAVVGVAHREHAARAAVEGDVAAAGQLPGVIETQRGVGADRDRAAGGADLEEVRIGVRIEDAGAQLESTAVEDDLASGAGHAGAQGSGGRLGAIVGRAADGKRASVDEDISRESVGPGEGQGTEAGLGEAAGRGTGDGRADGQRIARRVDADDEVSRRAGGQTDRAADGRGAAAGDQDAGSGDERVGGEAGGPVEEQAGDGERGALGDGARAAARSVDAIGTGSREARSAANGVRQTGVAGPIDCTDETKGVIHREIRRTDGSRGEGRGEEGRRGAADEPTGGLTRQDDAVRGRSSARDDEQSISADGAGRKGGESQAGVAARTVLRLDDAGAGAESQRTERLDQSGRSRIEQKTAATGEAQRRTGASGESRARADDDRAPRDGHQTG